MFFSHPRVQQMSIKSNNEAVWNNIPKFNFDRASKVANKAKRIFFAVRFLQMSRDQNAAYSMWEIVHRWGREGIDLLIDAMHRKACCQKNHKAFTASFSLRPAGSFTHDDRWRNTAREVVDFWAGTSTGSEVTTTEENNTMSFVVFSYEDLSRSELELILQNKHGGEILIDSEEDGISHPPALVPGCLELTTYSLRTDFKHRASTKFRGFVRVLSKLVADSQDSDGVNL